MIDQPNGVESIRHNHGIGEVLPRDGAEGGAQVHAHHPYGIFALKCLQIRRQREFTASQDYIVNLVITQIAEGGGEALLAGEEVLVDPEDLWALRRMPFFELESKASLEVALGGGGADLLPPRQAAAVDAVEMFLMDEELEGFGDSLVGEEAGK